MCGLSKPLDQSNRLALLSSQGGLPLAEWQLHPDIIKYMLAWYKSVLVICLQRDKHSHTSVASCQDNLFLQVDEFAHVLQPKVLLYQFSSHLIPLLLVRIRQEPVLASPPFFEQRCHMQLALSMGGLE